MEASALLWEWAALGMFVLYVMYSFCDGFGLDVARKIFWGIWFLVLCLWSFAETGHYDLLMILPGSCLFAFLLARIQRNENLRK